MDGKDIFKEILNNPELKELIGVSSSAEINEDYDRQSDYKEIQVIKSIIEAQVRHTSEPALFKTVTRIYDL